MENFKKRWEITQNWQLIHIILSLIATVITAYIITRAITRSWFELNATAYTLGLILGTLIISVVIIKLSLWLFTKLYDRWRVTYRWELAAIFLVFAITGSTAGKLSDPLMALIGLEKSIVSGWIYWPVRILLIFPIYQVFLVFFGWIFGQYAFFKTFAIKMVSRIGLGFLFSS